MELDDILRKSCIQIGESNLFGTGSGFYINEDTILTCFHCLEEFNLTKIPFYHNNIVKYAEYIFSPLSEKYDIALLKTSVKNSNAVLIQGGITPNDKVTFYGFSNNNPNGESVGLVYEGLSIDKNNVELIKFKDGVIRNGNSGSPILNRETGTIVGLIKETDNKKYPVGGYGIPLKSIISCYPEVQLINTKYNLENNIWKKLNYSHKKGLGIYDLTGADNHFFLFNTNISIDDIFIKPNYKIINYGDLETYNELSKTNSIISDCKNILYRLRFLLILGQFGTGKSIVSKKLQKELIEEGKFTIFLHCSDIGMIENYAELYEQIVKIKPTDEPLYCFFDGFDELNLLSVDKSEIIGGFLKNLIRLSKELDIYIILNSRNIHKKEDEVFVNISLQFDELRNESIEYVVLEEFKNEQIDDFLNAYSNAMAKQNQEQRLYISDIKKLHKNLKKACYNPLFLFWIKNTYYEKGIEKINDLYEIYNSFVKNTISGKFINDSNPNNPAIKEIQNKYKLFLRRLASEILIKNKSIRFDRNQMYDFYLDENKDSYSIINEQVSVDINIIASEIIAEDVLLNLSKKRIRENVLSNYFLDCNNNSWRFKDNNILFFLIAENYYEKIIIAIKEFENYYDSNHTSANIAELEFYKKLYDSFHLEKRIPLHPLSLEFLFQKIDNLSEHSKQFLWSFIKTLIDCGEILQITERNFKRLDIKKLNIDIILLLIFKRINTGGYDEINLIYFFKRYYWFISAAKIIDRNYLYLAQRFFKHSNIKGVELRRINFDGYNFDYSYFKDVHFIQDKFHDVRMNMCIMDKVKFTLCDLNNVSCDEFVGNVLFSNCIIEKLYIRNPISKEVRTKFKFKNCQIKWMEIHSKEKKSNHTIDIEFVGSDINTLIVDNTLFKMFSLRNCIYSPFTINEQQIVDFKIERSQPR